MMQLSAASTMAIEKWCCGAVSMHEPTAEVRPRPGTAKLASTAEEAIEHAASLCEAEARAARHRADELQARQANQNMIHCALAEARLATRLALLVRRSLD